MRKLPSADMVQQKMFQFEGTAQENKAKQFLGILSHYFGTNMSFGIGIGTDFLLSSKWGLNGPNWP